MKYKEAVREHENHMVALIMYVLTQDSKVLRQKANEIIAFPSDYINTLFQLKTTTQKNACFEFLLDKIPNYISKATVEQVLTLSEYVLYTTGNIYTTLMLIKQAQKRKHNFHQDIIAKCLLQQVHSIILSHCMNKSNAQIDGDAILHYYKRYDKLLLLINKSISSIQSLYNMLLIQRIDCNEFSENCLECLNYHNSCIELSGKIKNSDKIIGEYYNNIKYINKSTNPKSNMQLINDSYEYSNINSILLNMSDIFVLVCSTFGKFIIKHASSKCEEFLEYGPSELRGKSALVLLPQIYSEKHSRFIPEYMKAPYSIHNSKKRVGYVLSKSGYSLPIKIYLTFLHGIQSSSIHALLCIQNIEREYDPTYAAMLLRLDYTICSVTKGSVVVLKRPLEELLVDSRITDILHSTKDICNSDGSPIPLLEKFSHYVLQMNKIKIAAEVIGYEAVLLHKTVSNKLVTQIPKDAVALTTVINVPTSFNTTWKSELLKLGCTIAIIFLLSYLLSTFAIQNKKNTNALALYQAKALSLYQLLPAIYFIYGNTSSEINRKLIYDYSCRIVNNQYQGYNQYEEGNITFAFILELSTYICTNPTFATPTTIIDKHIVESYDKLQGYFYSLVECSECNIIRKMLTQNIALFVCLSITLIFFLFYTSIDLESLRRISKYINNTVTLLKAQLTPQPTPNEGEEEPPELPKAIISTFKPLKEKITLILSVAGAIVLLICILPIYNKFMKENTANLSLWFISINQTLLIEGFIAFPSLTFTTQLLLDNENKLSAAIQNTELKKVYSFYNTLYTDGISEHTYGLRCQSTWGSIGLRYLISQMIYDKQGHVMDDCLGM
jgi:hypothetical protein